MAYKLRNRQLFETTVNGKDLPLMTSESDVNLVKGLMALDIIFNGFGHCNE